MPLSRFTQTLPLDFAEATSESEAAPVAGAFVEVFFGGAELVAGALEVEELAGVLGAIVDLLDAGVAGAEFGAGAAICESLAAVDFFLLFLVVVVLASLLAVVLVAAVPLLAGAAAVVSALFLRLFFVVVPESAVVLAAWSPLAAASVDFFLRLFFVVLVSAVVLPPAVAD
jgi:hypothetical protein